jgi:two-component system cell cycle sensor histidine kinase/response regulator CckA
MQAVGNREPVYSSLVNSLDGIIWEADPETFQFVFVSKQAERILGYPVERWLSDPDFWPSHIHPDDAAWAVAFCSHATAEGRSHQFEYRMIAADGRVVWLRDVVTVVLEEGRPVRLRGVMMDVTERRRFDESGVWKGRYMALRADVGAALARTDVSPREALQACSDAIVRHLETTFTCIWTVEAAAGRLSLRAASCSVASEDPLAGLPDLSAEARRIAGERLPVLGDETSIENSEWANREGIVSFLGVPLLIGERLVGVVMAYSRRVAPDDAIEQFAPIADIIAHGIERRRLEEAHFESERRLSTLLANLPGMVYRCRNARDWPMEFVSEGCYSLTGHAADELLAGDGTLYASLIAPEYHEPIEREVADALAEGRLFQLVYRFRTAAGEERWAWERGRGVYDADGNVVAIEGFITDITERRRAEEALRSSEIYFRSLIENSTDVVMVLGEGGTILYASPAVEQIVGVEAEDLAGRNMVTLIHPDDLRGAVEVFQTYLDRDEASPRVEYRVCREDGTRRLVEAIGKRFVDDAGRLKVIVNLRDITEHRKLEEQLRHAQKMEAIGRFAGGVAHDFNNLLTTIIGYSELSLREPRLDGMLRFNVEEIKRSGERATSLTRQLLAFSRKQILQPRVLDLNTLVSDMQRMLERLIGEDVVLTTELAPELGYVKADPGQIEQVIMNLVVNARDAMPRGGSLRIRTAGVTVEGA